VKWRVFAFLD